MLCIIGNKNIINTAIICYNTKVITDALKSFNSNIIGNKEIMLYA
jgi:hypothetical protein